MKILYVADFSSLGNQIRTEEYITRALLKLGNFVEKVDYLKQNVLRKAKLFKPEVILLSRCERLSPVLLDKIRKSLPDALIIQWQFDLMNFRDGLKWFVPLAQRLNIVFNKEESNFPMYRKAGINVHYLDQAVPSDFKFMENLNGNYSADISFLGSILEHDAETRLSYLKMIDEKYILHIYSRETEELRRHGFKNVFPPVFDYSLSKICSKSKIIIGFNVAYNVYKYWSSRIYLTLGSGGFYLTKYISGLEEVFENKKHLIWFKTKEECLELIDHYLNNDEERERIRRVGYGYVHKNHTYLHRCRQFLNIVKKEYYLKKESALQEPERYTIDFWTRDKSFKFVKENKQYLKNPVINLGCGPGSLSILTARLGFYIVGVGCVKKNIENANRLKDKNDSVHFLRSFLNALPFKGKSFSSGIMKGVLEHILEEDRDEVLEEIKRVLKPGANLLITVLKERCLGEISTEHTVFFRDENELTQVLRKHFVVHFCKFDTTLQRLFALCSKPYSDNYNRLLFDAPNSSVSKEQRMKYLDFFKGCSSILELGCGRGEFLELLKEKNIKGKGVDSSHDSVDICQRKGLNVEKADVIEYLKNTKDKYDGIFAAHIIEHLYPEEAEELIKKSYNVLSKNGKIVIITPNPQDLDVMLGRFWSDPTHIRPYPLTLLESLLKYYKFEVIAEEEDRGWEWYASKFQRARIKLVTKIREKIIGRNCLQKGDIYIVGQK